MKKETFKSELFISNRKKLASLLLPESVAIVNPNDELTRNGDQDFPYRQNSDLFYLTGLNQEGCILTLCPDHPEESMREIIFAIKPNEQLETWTGHKYTKNEIREFSGIKTVKWLDDFGMTLRDLVLSSDNIYINLNEYTKYLTDVEYFSNRFAIKISNMYPAHNLKRLAPLITKQRLVKSQEELIILRKACDITDKALRRVLSFTKPGVMEYEIDAEITYEFLKNGASGHAYQPIIASGRNALVLHYIENSMECKDGDLMLLDIGAEYNNYAADCSRTIPVNGKFSARQKECYEAVLKVQKEAIKLYVPGNTIDIINKAVWKMMEKEMIGLELFTEEDVKNQNPDQPLYTKYLMHGVAHFIGLDVHDVGGKYKKFEKGMVLTCEPGLYIKEEGLGIRIENDIVVDDTPVDLMANIPREVDEIERLMKE